VTYHRNGNGNGATADETRPQVPYSEDAERSVLGAMLLDNDVIAEVTEVLRAEDFYLKRHQAIFEAIVAEWSTGGSAELVGVTDRLKLAGKIDSDKDVLFLASLEDYVVTTGHAPELARRIAEKSRLRKLLAAAKDIYREAAAQDRPVDELLGDAQRRLYEIAVDSRDMAIHELGDIWAPTIDDIEAEKAGNGEGLQTGFIDLDARFKMDRSSLTILGARPSIGKTAFGLNIAYNVARSGQGRVLFFSMEMNWKQLTRRLMAMATGIDASKLQNPRYLSGFEITRLRDYQDWARTMPLAIEQTPGVSLTQLSSITRRYARMAGDLRLVVVDYLGLMRLEGRKNANTNELLGETSVGLKRLAMELGIPILCLHQLNRAVERRADTSKRARPVLSDLRDSGHIEQDADNVLFLHRERVQQTQDETADGGFRYKAHIPTEVIVAKQRQGPIYTVELQFDLKSGLFHNTLS
jgi:replicative DNA helicase